MQRHQQIQPAGIQRFNLRQIEHNHSSALFGEHRILQSRFLAANNSACNVNDRDIFSTFNPYGKHDLLLSLITYIDDYKFPLSSEFV